MGGGTHIQAERDKGTGQRDCEKQRGMEIRTKRWRRKKTCDGLQDRETQKKRGRGSRKGMTRKVKGEVG